MESVTKNIRSDSPERNIGLTEMSGWQKDSLNCMAVREVLHHAVPERMRELFSAIGLEAVVWTGAFVYLAIHNPYTQAEFTLCPLRNLGFHYCPGCGLGRSISFLLHGDIIRSVQTHLLGIPATIILSIRTLSLYRAAFARKQSNKLSIKTRNYHGEHLPVNADASR